VPFTGPAGMVLNHIIKYTELPFEYLITYSVLCRPQTIVYLSSEAEAELYAELKAGEDYEIYDHDRDPSPSEIEACKPHIDELINDFDPHGIVHLGHIAKRYKTSLPTVELTDPTSISRLEYKLQTVRKQSFKLQKFLKTLYVSNNQT
jgi:uracil-DNA glycosylase